MAIARVTRTTVFPKVLSPGSKMMGLGNGRRSMKSPPLILAALVACVIVLGFNYWIASSRSVELQTRIVELEGRVRRAAAERGAVELKKNEFQGELQKQREQLDRIQSSHSFQLENVNKLHQDEKAVLVNNITTGEKLIRDLQDQLKALQKSYGRLQQDIFQFQKNQTSLEKKFSYDLSQCISQMKEVKEQCEERIEEVVRKRNEALVSRDDQRQQALKPQAKLQETVPPKEQTPQEEGDVPRNKSQVPAPSSEVWGLKPHVQNEETNEIQVASEEHGLQLMKASIQEQAAVDGTRVGAEKLDQNIQVPGALLARPEEDSQFPERDQLVIRGGQESQHDQLVVRGGQESQRDQLVFRGGQESQRDQLVFRGGQESQRDQLVVRGGQESQHDQLVVRGGQESQHDQLVVRGGQESQHDQLVVRGGQELQRAAEEGGDQQNLGDDYNLNENEAEPEREKQAALAGDDRNLSVLNAEAQKRGIIDLPDGGEKRSHILNEVGVHVPQQA
ncbi:Golgi membrane protein 1 isoform X2 [Rattus norvegicus]|uniref:Golgi membrane protein 1 n=1 Tax=Rattus norvegicus TaxID=10116 RepID=A0A8I5ZPY1_RAT